MHLLPCVTVTNGDRERVKAVVFPPNHRHTHTLVPLPLGGFPVCLSLSSMVPASRNPPDPAPHSIWLCLEETWPQVIGPWSLAFSCGQPSRQLSLPSCPPSAATGAPWNFCCLMPLARLAIIYTFLFSRPDRYLNNFAVADISISSRCHHPFNGSRRSSPPGGASDSPITR